MPDTRTSSAPRSPRVPSRRLERARATRERLKFLFGRRRQDLAAIAHGLAFMKRERLFDMLGYTSVSAYAWAEHGMGKSKVSELIGISTESERLPRVREAFDSGRLEWTKAREVVKVATPETEGEWLQKAERLSGDGLRAARGGRPPEVRRGLTLSSEQVAEYDQLVAAEKAEIGVVTDAEAALSLMRKGASGERGEAPTKRVVITWCPTCEEAHMESREGRVQVGLAAVAQAQCDGEVHDLRDEKNAVKRTIPAKIKRRVLDRDRRRCQVPGCRAMCALNIHHVIGWKNGHDPRTMVTLCDAHHRLHHDGKLRIEGTAPNFRFALVDGTVLGEASLRAVAPSEVGSRFWDENSEGAAAEFSDENSEGAAAGFSNENSERAVAEFSDENSRRAVAEFSDENSEGVAAGFSDENSEGAAAGFSNENSERAVAEFSDENSRRAVAEFSDENSRGAVAEFSDENSRGAVAEFSDENSRRAVAEFSDENSRGAAAGFSDENSEAEDGRNAHLDPPRADRIAISALRSMGMRAREAKRRVRRLRDAGDRRWTWEDLVRAALQAA